MGEENKDIYICFTQNKDVALIISEKDKKSMYISKIKLDPSFYKEFENSGEYYLLQNIDGSWKESESFEELSNRIKRQERIVNVLKTEIENHFSGDFTNNVLEDMTVDEIKTQIVTSIKRMEIEESIEQYCFWLDVLWMRVFRMTKSDLYMLLGYNMEFHCMDSGGNTIFNMPINLSERIGAMFSIRTGELKCNYGIIDDYKHFTKPYKRRMIQLINDCYSSIDKSIKNGYKLKNIVFDYHFDRCVFYSDYLLYVENMLSDYIDPEDFSILNHTLIRKYKNDYIKEMKPALYFYRSINVKFLSKVFDTEPYPFVKTWKEGCYIKNEWINEENIAI